MAFLAWFTRAVPGGETPLLTLTRAGVAHLYFVTIHPFEDGNGRIALEPAGKAIAENPGHPALVPLSQTINRARQESYARLQQSNHSLEITPWLRHFAQVVLDAQAQADVEFIITKTRLFDLHRGQFNARQEKVLLRMFQESPAGFTGGLSAEKYIRITGTSHPTAARDLHDLMEKSALYRTGKLKGTRYHLNLPVTPAL